MSGPRVSSGKDSKQDYATPLEFIVSVEKRFGLIQFDLAAHAANKKHARYFAPPETDDPQAYGLDAFAFDWSQLEPKGTTLWLNPPFSSIEPWVAKCNVESQRGASITVLVPAVMTNWFRDHIAGRADVFFLSGRLSFDGINVYPKDCMLAHFHPTQAGRMALWDWKKDIILASWILAPSC